MRFVKATNGKFSFKIDPREKQMLFQLLELYPLVPVGYHELSRSEDKPDDQQMLDEALAEQRTENKNLILAMMADKSRFRTSGDGVRLILDATELEWLLQVLNDVRVGGWLALGSPDGPMEVRAAINEKTIPFFLAMEKAGEFQMALLDARSGRTPDEG